MFPLKNYVMSKAKTPGAFGYIRKYDIHTGVDIYTTEGAEVFAIEDGKVLQVDIFTGPKIGLGWWNETWAVMIEGESGVINYGEIKPSCVIGQEIKVGDIIGIVIPVLSPNKIRLDIHGHSCSMLHVELYRHGFKDFAIWDHEQEQPEGLLDPTELLVMHMDDVSITNEEVNAERRRREVS